MKKFLFTAVLAALLMLPTAGRAQSDPLQGKQIGIIGDSYVRNHREPVENTWHYKFAKKHGMQYFNYGRNGNSISLDLKVWGPAMYKRYTEMKDSLDYVVVIAGHNDGVPGRIDSIGVDVFKERLGILCQGLIDKYPHAKIFFFTPWTCENFEGSLRQQVVDAMLEVCGSYGIPIFDAARRSNIFAADEQFRKTYFQGGNGSDRAHLNAAGHDLFLPVAERFLLQCPEAPDYTDPALWITKDDDADGTGADVFYVVSTWEKDWWTADSTVCHYADVYNAVHREHMATEINGVAAYMAPGNRFYAPYYRHTTIDAFMTQNEDTIRSRTRLAMGDVCDAFDHFLQQRDASRPLIVAGFSQGGLAVVELLKHMSDETYRQLAAAYVLGYKVTPEDTAACHRILPAEGEGDTGVTICYNTVKDVKYVKPVIAATCFGINPVNWRTDDTPATLHDTITVRLDPDYHVLVVTGYSGAEYHPYGDLINVGDIHSCEPWLYSECLRKNFAVRTRQWRKKQ